MSRPLLVPVAAAGLALSACAPASETPALSTPEASDVSTLDVSNCEPADGVSGHVAGEETTGQAGERDIGVAPEIGTGFRSGMQEVRAQNFAVTTANPVATKAACEVLRGGGNAADAVVTAQFVLGLVEPQSSGIGGGGYILYSDAASGRRVAIDGREVAPLAADENYLIHVSDADPTPPLPDARSSGRSIGVPGIVAALAELHRQFGSDDWAADIQPAINLAQQGFEVSPRLAASIEDSAAQLAASPNAATYFLDADGQPLAAGTRLTNPEYAATLAAIAEDANNFYTGAIAADIASEATRAGEGLTPSLMTTADIAGYTPEVREALCVPYKGREVCGMPPSSSGGVAVLETLRLLEGYDLAQYAPDNPGPDGALSDVEAIHLVAEAERLAYADRDAYVADPAFVSIPGGSGALLADSYTSQRAGLIDPARSLGTATPGVLEQPVGVGADLPEHGTTHVNVIDAQGNAASFTSSVEAAFGSFHFTRGFVLNNQLTDFSAEPLDASGQPAANRVEPAKRPRSSMAPFLVFGPDGAVEMALGSPGGSLIIQYVLKTFLGITEWGLNPQQAVSAPNFGARNTPQTGIGGEHPLVKDGGAAGVVDELSALGHEVVTDEMVSGLSVLMRRDGGIVGGADPRREGIVLGG
ncbi:gamma-glutamyltransferase family protein [Corynebacterium auris]|uniref:gamma-glutamyltransferase family protein n=1 Tax=Corynebacterium auris TaxID=44750 RepID=UPI0025B33731|nr:gamma-glutamyltransferase family protein [Corynebacterium auris]WJY68490.1 Gamma-glutamyltranspeptidase precursor [Corynebacterium auris]